MTVIAFDREQNRKAKIIADLGEYTAGNFAVGSAPAEFAIVNPKLQDFDGAMEISPENLSDDNQFKVRSAFPAKRVLYRQDTGEPLSIVGSRYQITQYVDAWKAADLLLKEFQARYPAKKQQHPDQIYTDMPQLDQFWYVEYKGT